MFRALVAAAPTDPFADDALFELARLEEEKLGDPLAAAADYARVASEYPDSRLAVRAARRADELGKTLGPGGAPVAAEWARIFYGVAGRPRADTVRLLEDFLARHPDFADAAHAQVWLASLLGDEGRTAEALARLGAVPPGPWRQRAERAEGDLRVASGDVDGAEAAYRAADDEAGLHRVSIERWRHRFVLVAWAITVGAMVAGVATVRLAAGTLRPLVRPPVELLFLLPVAVLFGLAGLTENAILGHALQIICLGGLVAAWLSGAALEAVRTRGVVTLRRALTHGAVAAAGVLSVCYIAVTRERLVDQLWETLRYGMDR